MIKPGSRWVIRKLTDVYSNQPDGTLHAYDYFKDKDGTWIYNFDFHHRGNFAPVQLKLEKRVPIAKAIKMAREVYSNTTYEEQPYSWD